MYRLPNPLKAVLISDVLQPKQEDVMTHGRIFLSLLLIFCTSQPALSQRSQQSGGKTDVYIYVEFEDLSPAAQSYKVQLLSSTRLQVAMDFTNDRGQAIFRGLSAGDYR